MSVRDGGRRRVSIIAVLACVVMVAVYAFAAISYSGSLQESAPNTKPPAAGVAVTFVPQLVLDTDQELTGYLVVTPAESLLSGDVLREDITVTVAPAVGVGAATVRKGQAPTPQGITLPTPGVVEQYPFDTYRLDVRVTATTADGSGIVHDLPVTTSTLFRIPGWRQSSAVDAQSQTTAPMTATVERSGSTKAIAVMLLVVMVALATIATLVARATIRGHLMEMSVAAWITAMLFALIPIRGFLPGAPPIGSWIDILVFFWVELALMLSVAAVATALLVRAHRRSDETTE